jgi:2-polyprenyl-3-methyl-5-hydroxy-6-metoxy-1,4-benzoquinol methylase
MKRHTYDESWPELWKISYEFDQLELWGGRRDLGYSYSYKTRRDWILQAASNLTPPGGSILDIAGASGNFTLPLAEQGFHVTWNDLIPEMIGLVQRKYESGSIEFCPGNIFDLSNEWIGGFDSILATEVIEHMAHPDELLACAQKMLRPGGCLFLSTPNGKYFRFHYPRFSDCPDPEVFESVQFQPGSEGHIFLLDTEECRALAGRAGLETERLELFNNPLTRGHIKLGHLLPFLPARFVFAIESGTRWLPKGLREKIQCQMVAVLRKPKS